VIAKLVPTLRRFAELIISNEVAAALVFGCDDGPAGWRRIGPR